MKLHSPGGDNNVVAILQQ